MLKKIIKTATTFGYQTRQGMLENNNKFVFFEKDKTGDLVIFVHGLGNNLIYLNQKLVEYFIQRGFNILTFNLDGHGDHSKTNFSQETISDSIGPALDYAHSQGDYRIHMVGYSLGAYLAARYTNMHPDEISSLHLIAPLGSKNITSKILVNELRALLSGPVLGSLAKWGFGEMVPAIGPFRRKKFPLRHHEKSILKSLDKWLEDDEKNGFFAKSQNTHGTLIYGELDEICNYRDESLWNMRFPYLESQIIQGASHLTTPLYEECCERILNEIQKTQILLPKAV